MITPEEVKSKTFKRFWSKIKFDESNRCWEWQGFRFNGYGRFRFNSDNRLASRVMFQLVRSEDFVESLNVLHTCDNPPCVNPNHLWIGTQKDNGQDMKHKGRGKGWESHGTNNGRAKLTDEKVVEIRTLHKNGLSCEKIAIKFGVAESLIWRIKEGISWKHVK